MNQFFLMMTGLLLATSSMAAEAPKKAVAAVATVEKLVGEAFLNGKPLKNKAEIFQAGTLTTKAKSFVKIAVPGWASSISVGPDSSMELHFGQEKEKGTNFTLTGGVSRWISTREAPAKTGVQLRTKSAAFGIRGTDFLAKYNPDGGSEIIVFDGNVLFQSRLVYANAEGSEKLVNKGQWGGVGGKFGPTVGDLVNLPADKLAEFAKSME